MKIKFKKLNDNAVIPEPALSGDVGHDLCAIEVTSLQPMSVTKVKTGICIASYDSRIEVAHQENLTIYPEIKSRSGLASKGIVVVGGIIDTKYRGEIIVLLLNTTNARHTFYVHDKCAQIVFTACLTSPTLVLEETDVVEETERGTRALGSTDH